LKCKSIIEIEKELRKKNMKKKRPFVPVATPGTKEHRLLSRTGVSGWETGTITVSQPGQINVFVVVVPNMHVKEVKAARAVKAGAME